MGVRGEDGVVVNMVDVEGDFAGVKDAHDGSHRRNQGFEVC